MGAAWRRGALGRESRQARPDRRLGLPREAAAPRKRTGLGEGAFESLSGSRMAAGSNFERRRLRGRAEEDPGSSDRTGPYELPT
jgi:hypothetical protein